MDAARQLQSQRRWPWAVAILLMILLNIALLGVQRGECFDYVPESGALSTCRSSPLLGVTGSWLVAIVSVVAIIYFTLRLVQIARARRN